MKNKIDLKIYPRMKEFFDAGQRFKILVKGRQVGATTACVNYLLLQCFKNQKKDYLWVDTNLTNIKKYYDDKFYPKLKLLPTKLWNFNKQTLVLKVNNNRITFGSYEAGEERLEGGTYDLIIVNECGFLLKESFLWERTLLPMLLVRSGKAIFVGTPKTGKNSYHYDLVTKVGTGELSQDLWYVDHISMDDAEFMSDDDKKMYYNTTSPENIATEYYGKFRDVSSNTFAKSFNKSKHIHSVPFDNRYVGLSFDFNVGKMSCLVFGFHDTNYNSHIDKTRNKKIIKIYHEFNTMDFDTIKDFSIFVKNWLQEKELVPVVITGDASGNHRNYNSDKTAYNTIKQVFELHVSKFVVRTKNLEHTVSAEICNIMLGNYDVRIDSSCKGLINELAKIEFATGKDTIDKSNPNIGHILDCFRYILDNFCYNNCFKFRI